jgi:hypothetical protein
MERLKTPCGLGWSKSWCIGVTTRFIAKMEDVLEVCQRPDDLRYPVVCLDEIGKELRLPQLGEKPCLHSQERRAAAPSGLCLSTRRQR